MRDSWVPEPIRIQICKTFWLHCKKWQPWTASAMDHEGEIKHQNYILPSLTERKLGVNSEQHNIQNCQLSQVLRYRNQISSCLYREVRNLHVVWLIKKVHRCDKRPVCQILSGYVPYGPTLLSKHLILQCLCIHASVGFFNYPQNMNFSLVCLLPMCLHIKQFQNILLLTENGMLMIFWSPDHLKCTIYYI